MSSVVKPNYNVFPMFTVLPVDVPGPEWIAFLSNYCYDKTYFIFLFLFR
jgi:hypothetical protein